MNKRDKIIALIITVILSVSFARLAIYFMYGASAAEEYRAEAYVNEDHAIGTSLFLRPTVTQLSRLEERAIPILATVTAYSSDPEQTDDSPFITASNTHVRPGIIANNCLPFGTKVEVAGVIYEVEDRMNSRYGCDYFDIWFESTEEAWKFGRQLLAVQEI